jgi:hypothetical protein
MEFNGNTVQWYQYIRGRNPDYPVTLLKMNYDLITAQVARFRKPEADPRLIDHYQSPMSIHQWQMQTPMVMEALTQLTLGGPMHVYHGGLQHARVRYYDANGKRPGLPPGVAALVQSLTDEETTLSLVNLDLQCEQLVVIQAGTFGEHTFREAYVIPGEGTTKTFPVNGKWCAVRLGPSAGITLRFTMDRYVNSPSYETPWDPDGDAPHLITGRQPS